MNLDFSKIGAAFTVGKAVFEAGKKAFDSRKEKSEDEQMQAVVDELRLRILTGQGGNCIITTVGSEEDRFLSKMVAKGLLVRTMMNGYMLAESFRQHGGLY